MMMPSPLHEVTSRAGAVAVEEAGWSMPAHFGSAPAEYDAARTGAVLFDLSHRGKVEVKGKDAVSFLQNLSTNDIRALAKGKQCEAFLATNKAKAVAYVHVHHIAMGTDGIFLLDADPGCAEKIFKHLDRHLISEQVELLDQTPAYARMHLAGPQAAGVLQQAIEHFPKLRERPSGGLDLHLVPGDVLNLPGYDLFCAPSHASSIWDWLIAAGAKPAGLQAYELLRVEAGTPVFGKDIDEDRFVVELDRGDRAICYTKGCYLGQEPIVMARDRGHVNRHFRGLIGAGAAPLPAGTKLFQATTEAGQVTSSVVSPRLGPIALAYIRRGNEAPGTKLEAEVSGARTAVTVAALPLDGSGSRPS
jgi:folate-binding protein YgfZ